MGTVSILICTYGDEKWAELARRRALPAASNQGALEVIVHHEPEVSLASLAETRNAAALKAIGDWLCFLDADDELAPGYIPAMAQASEEHRPWSLLVPRVQYVTVLEEVEIAPDETGFITKSEKPTFPNRQRPMTELNHCVIGTLVPRELFLGIGGFRGDLPCYEDWEMFLRCVWGGAELHDVPDAIYRAYRNPHGRNNGTAGVVRDRTYWRIRKTYEKAA